MTKEMKEMSCSKCGSKVIWEHPEMKGLFMCSSDYVAGSELCRDCKQEIELEKMFKQLPISYEEYYNKTNVDYDMSNIESIVKSWNLENKDSNKEIVECKHCNKYSFWGGYEDDPTMWSCEKCGDIFCGNCVRVPNSEEQGDILCKECLTKKEV